ncbi:MAG: beta-N-acetylhexosaminidase [Elusimicrobia bacterium]|nr:beta-N-acetylhexosaminidase [Elusimicrobiota bacterium]
MTAPFLFGFEGKRVSRATARLLRDTEAAGVLLLNRNIDTPAQTRSLVHALEDAVGRRLIVAIDHEGGWVMRFTTGVTFLPGNAALGRAGDPALAERAGGIAARELSALGINFNLAPVLDVLGAGYNPGIGIRSFGRDPYLVGKLGAAFICGQEGHGVAACVKHFPGKGAAMVDAHVDLPVVKISGSELRNVHLAPFKAAIKNGVAAVMTSHVLMPALDSKNPATFSRKVAHGLLRKQLGFKGLIVSDDLCMGAITKRLPVGKAAAAALAAGHDLLIVAHGESLMREAAEAAGLTLEGRPERAAIAARLAAFARRWTGRKTGPSPTPDDALARQIARAAVEHLRVGGATLPLRWPAWERPRILAVLPDLTEVQDRFAFEDGPQGPAKRLSAALKRWPAKVSFTKAGVLSETVPVGLKAAAKRADLVLFFCFEARRFPGQRAALETLRAAARTKLVAVLLRSPADLDLLGSEDTALTAHGYRHSQLDALLGALR